MEEEIEVQGEESAATLAGDLRAVIGRLRRRLREQGNPGDLTWSQKSVLRHLEREGPATVSALARLEGVRPQSMGATVAVLTEAGLVTGAPDPKDGRQTILSLTETCRRRLEAGRAARQDWLLKAILARLTPAEQENLAGAVALLRRLADQ
ncbi:MAG: MarR family winged helix-turn-helix transcriptional regulator [Pararhizobium sp.]